jgi:diguanylate cyclase (GGDEF)-like protein
VSRTPALARAQKQLELAGTALGWTSAECARHGAALAAAFAKGASATAREAFAEKLAAWSTTALERRPEAIESPRLAALSAVAALVRESPTAAEALERSLAALQAAIRFESATCFLFDAETEQLRPVVTTGRHVDLIPDVQFDLGQGLSSWIARARRPVLLSGLKGEQDETHPAQRPGSFLSVPLVVAREVLGVVNVGHSRTGAFNEADRDLLAAAASVLCASLARERASEEARRRAVTDELTGLANRAQFEGRLAEEIEKSKRYGHPFSILWLDPERFHALNQAYGRAYGDSCLVSLAALLKERLRKSDLVARLGPGDEFAALLPHQSPEQALLARDRIAVALHSHSFPRRRRLTVSLGVATYPHDAADAAALLVHAQDDARPAAQEAA